MDSKSIIKKLTSLANPKNVEGMARFGINSQNTLGVSMPILRKMAKEIKKDHPLALELWNSKIHEARILACLIADPKQLTESQMESWVSEFDSWDVCDQCCSNLFDKTDLAYAKAIEWSERKEEFIKRAGFVLMATLSVHNKKMRDKEFFPFLERIIKESTDDRNFVMKAVNWALRQIGKRNQNLYQQAIQTAGKILKLDSKSARWIATDALREFKNEKIIQRIIKKTSIG